MPFLPFTPFGRQSQKFSLNQGFSQHPGKTSLPLDPSPRLHFVSSVLTRACLPAMKSLVFEPKGRTLQKTSFSMVRRFLRTVKRVSTLKVFSAEFPFSFLPRDPRSLLPPITYRVTVAIKFFSLQSLLSGHEQEIQFHPDQISNSMA